MAHTVNLYPEWHGTASSKQLYLNSALFVLAAFGFQLLSPPLETPSVIQLLKIIRNFHQQSPVSAYGESTKKHDEDLMRYFIHTFSAGLWFQIKITHEERDSSF